jgi:hypothetical protein
MVARVARDLKRFGADEVSAAFQESHDRGFSRDEDGKLNCDRCSRKSTAPTMSARTGCSLFYSEWCAIQNKTTNSYIIEITI